MSDDKILLQYQKVADQIRRMEDSASRIKKLGGQEMDQIHEKIRSGWQGENADAFLKKYDSLQQKMRASASDLGTLADEMKKSADRIVKADSRMADQISKR